jgi:hypothetical protein
MKAVKRQTVTRAMMIKKRIRGRAALLGLQVSVKVQKWLLQHPL